MSDPKSDKSPIIVELDDLAKWTVKFNSSRYNQIVKIRKMIQNEK